MNKTGLILILLFLIVIPSILAETSITVITKLNHDINIIVNDMNNNPLENFNENSGSEGKVTVISNASVPKINLIIIIRKYGKIIEINGEMVHKFEGRSTGIPISINLEEMIQTVVNTTNATVANATTNVTSNETESETNLTEDLNDTSIETEIQTDEIEENKTGITGGFVRGTKAVFTSRITYYIIGGLFIIGVLFFAVFITRTRLKKKGPYINFKIGEGNETKITTSHDERLAEAERKLEEARKELEEIKNRKKKLEEVRAKLKKDKEELERLERGESP